jgi:hypothetical protein
MADGQVYFCYRHAQTSRGQTTPLPAQEFTRRFLQYVLPQGFRQVRYDGRRTPVHRTLLHQLQLALAGQAPLAPRRPLPRRALRTTPAGQGQNCL